MTVKYKESFDYLVEGLERHHLTTSADEELVKQFMHQAYQLGYQAGKDNGPWHPMGGEE